ncbi:type II toxin-antitoxin system VapC family toxin [Synechococcus moorigangaii CMS01]|nr:type II toxin-antitoxin system VapC family toxin [Synechococcus moorigangaii CMS01]
MSPNSTVYLDTVILIYTVEKNVDYLHIIQNLWVDIERHIITAYTSELTLMESLVMPLKLRNDRLVNTYEKILQKSVLKSLSITPSILKLAAQLRANNKIQTPDAIHLATAIACGCDVFLTNDIALQKIPDLGLEILVLKDLI